MEIIKVGDKSFKIKARNTSFIINPEKKIDGDIVLLTQKPKDYNQFEGKLVIDGPGEYEACGVSIKAELTNGSLSFDMLEESQRILILSSLSGAKLEETEDYTATVVLFDGRSKDSISKIGSQVVIIICPEDILPQDISNIKKTDKVNLKKKEELNGSMVYLSK